MAGQNVDQVRSLYESFAKGDVPSVLAALDPHIEWNEAEGFPYADRNPYIGPTAVLEGVLMRLGGEWENFGVGLEELLDAGDTVVARGRYSGVYKKTGAGINAQFAHVWTLRDGKVVKFQQYTDTAQIAKAVSG
jgi:uncharacterized protein